MTVIPKRASERLIKETKKFQRILAGAKDRDINESDTVVIIRRKNDMSPRPKV